MALEGQERAGGGVDLQAREALDSYIPQPQRLIDRAVSDGGGRVLSRGGTVVTGQVGAGCTQGGDELEIVGLKPTLKTVCTGWNV
jgi:elongation factor Tu